MNYIFKNVITNIEISKVSFNHWKFLPLFYININEKELSNKLYRKTKYIFLYLIKNQTNTFSMEYSNKIKKQKQ